MSSSASSGYDADGNEILPHHAHAYQQQQNWRKLELAETLVVEFMDECRTSGECFGEYLGLVKNVILADKDCKYRLVFGKCDILNRIESLLHKEIRYLSDLERLSEALPSASKSSLLSFGHVVSIFHFAFVSL